MRIVVLAGGLSMERNVSLSSGNKICRALRSRGHQAILVDMFMGFEDYDGKLEDVFDAPDGFCVVKPVANGSSVGVSIAHTGAELKKALEECLQFGAQVVLEQYISGREIQVGIIAGKALPSIEIIPKTGFYDYANKYQAGAAEEICPSPIPEDWEMRVRTATETVYRLIGLSVYSRADFIVTPDGTPYFLEINTLPGMTKTSLLPQEAAAVGIGYEELCEKIVEESLKQKRGL